MYGSFGRIQGFVEVYTVLLHVYRALLSVFWLFRVCMELF